MSPQGENLGPREARRRLANSGRAVGEVGAALAETSAEAAPAGVPPASCFRPSGNGRDPVCRSDRVPVERAQWHWDLLEFICPSPFSRMGRGGSFLGLLEARIA